MRSLWAGLLLLLFSTSGALAQASGYVRELGFGGFFRADCWTPLLVHLDSTAAQPVEYQIQVHQQDLDQDTVLFTRTVALNPNAHEDFWVYFLPQPTAGGLKGSSLPLKDVLKVHLYDKKGKTHVAPLPVQAQADDLELPSSTGSGNQAVKMVLVIVGDQANFHDEYSGAEGTTERIQFIPIRIENLPDHLLGYQAVDAILWLNGDWNQFRTLPAFSAMQQWVKGGGNLAVCQPADRTQLEPLANADMLPIIAKTGSGGSAAWAIQNRQKKNVISLANIAYGNGVAGFNGEAWDALNAVGKTFEVAYAMPRPDAMVDAWIDWDAEGDRPAERSPLIARRAYGLGTVAWVAQNLSAADLATLPDPNDKPQAGKSRRTLATNGWPRIWDRVFGWRNQSRTDSEVSADSAGHDGSPYHGGSSVDLGAAVSKGMEHAGRSTAYVVVAIFFFIGYWIIAGPGSYLYLASKKKKGLSWMIFGASAVVATLVTVLVVKLLLGGGVEVKHVSVVRLFPEAPASDGTPRFAANINSRIGLYIPRDGSQRVSLPEPGADHFGAIAAYAEPPIWLRADKDAGFTDTARYIVDTDEILSGKSPSVDFFFRSTLKKVQAQWSGTVPEGIVGSAQIQPVVDIKVTPPLIGQLTNRTGHALQDVYFVFAYGWQDVIAADGRIAASDRVLYLPSWDNGSTIDLGTECSKAEAIQKSNVTGSSLGGRFFGSIDPSRAEAWSKFWYGGLPGGGFGTEAYDDHDRGYLRSFPIMALVDRIGPSKRHVPEEDFRRDPVRRGFRDMDMSDQVASGRLVILGHASGTAVPLPLEVNDSRVEGEGVTFYEIALPLGRQLMRPVPATQPATKPTSQPATKP